MADRKKRTDTREQQDRQPSRSSSDPSRPAPEPDDEPVELSERGGVKQPERSPSEDHDRTRDRSLEE